MVTQVQESGLSVQEASRRDPLFGKMLDVDGHVYLPVEVFEDLSGDLGGSSILDFYKRFYASEEYDREKARNRDDVFGVKGMAALGAVEMDDRVEALDLMGVRAQLAFQQTFGADFRIDSAVAREMNSRANSYYIDLCKQSKGRVWPVMNINTGNPEWALKELERVLKIGGVGGINLSCATPPGGTSPAHSQWDPFWARIAEANVPALIHLGGGAHLCQRPGPDVPRARLGQCRVAARPASRARRGRGSGQPLFPARRAHASRALPANNDHGPGV
jgi:predicted TIM-barrel fold metal-dependent hydrolase